MLDDLKYIHQKDVSDAIGIAQKQSEELTRDFRVEGDSSHLEGVKNIVFAGMGGSALAALLSQSWPGYTIPFEVCRNYDLPNYIGPETLVIASSYSGNTEETLSALGQAEEKGSKIAIITSGGKLADLARQKNYALLVEPGHMQPRYATLYCYKALMVLLDRCGVGARQANQLAGKATFLQSAMTSWAPEVPTKDNPAKTLALELVGKSMVMYAGPKLAPAAYKWKISFNENAKNVAWYNQFPEINHNEFLGWTSHPVDKPYAVVELRSTLEHPRVQKRFEVTERLLSGRRPSPEVVNVQGSDVLEQLLWAVAFGDFVSIYVALLNGIDPTPVELIEKFKQQLDS